MRTILLASASFLIFGGAAMAQNSASPLSNAATNTSASNTHGTTAPRLPVAAEDASADQFLMHAQSALKRGRTGEAQEALERAETRVLSRSTEQGTSSTPDGNPKVAAIQQARQALGRGDRATAMQSIQSALATPSATTASLPADGGAMIAPPPTPWVGPGVAPGVKPGTLGGIATSVGSASGTGSGNGTRPQASFSGPSPQNAVPPGTLGGIATSVGSPSGTGSGQGNSPQASFSGPSPQNAVPPGTLGGIATSVGSPSGTGSGQGNSPQASFSGPTSAQVVIPGQPAPATP